MKAFKRIFFIILSSVIVAGSIVTAFALPPAPIDEFGNPLPYTPLQMIEITPSEGNGKYEKYFVDYLNSQYENENFEYGIGVLIDEDTDMTNEIRLLTQGYRIWEMDAAEYVVFKCMGESGDSIAQSWSRFYKEFLPQTNYAQTELTDYEIYFENKENGMFCELWIPVTK